MRRLKYLSLVLLLLITCTLRVSAGDFDLARDYYRHGLEEKAKEVLVEVINNPQELDSEKAKALNLLGEISYSEGNYRVAFEDWNRLVRYYPETTEARMISGRLLQLEGLFARKHQFELSEPAAEAFIKNGDFWSGSDNNFVIDTSWMDHVEMAIEWYDKVIKEFPGTSAAELAYQRKLFTLIGWDEVEKYGDTCGVRDDFDKYMPRLIDTFKEFKRNFPDSLAIQPFRYQIAQLYWQHKDWSNTRKWLQKIIDNSYGEKTFYTEAAKERLENLKY